MNKLWKLFVDVVWSKYMCMYDCTYETDNLNDLIRHQASCPNKP